jgi:hypothetical protein
MFCAPGLVFGGTDGVGSRFHLLRFRTRFRRFRGCRVPFSCFARPDSFSAVPRTSGPVFMFCTPGLIFKGTEGVGSRFHVLRSRTRFRRYRGRRVPFSCFALPDSFSRVPRASGLIFLFCALELAFGCTVVVSSGFHVLRSRTRFGRYRRRQVPFSCFALLHSLSAVLWSSAPIGGVEGVGSCFHVLRSRSRFPFSCFAVLNSFWRVARASGPVFMFCALELVFGGSEAVGSHFHVLCGRTRFRRYRGRQVPYSCFALPDSFSRVPRVSGPVFMFCAPGLVFGGTEGVGSRFHVLRCRTRFRGYRGRRVLFSCFALPDSLPAVLWASAPVFMFYAPELDLGGTDGVKSRFHVLHSRTRFRRYFSCRLSLSAVPRASGPLHVLRT